MTNTFLKDISFMSMCLFIFAILLQIQFDLFQSEIYTGLRIALSDLTLPIAGLLILFNLLSQKSKWPNWAIKHMYSWLAVTTAILVFATLNTYYTHSIWSQWAILNKVLGYGVMISYLALGGWLATNLDAQKLHSFIKVFCGFFFLILILQIACMCLMVVYPPSTWFFIDHDIWYPLEGLMANRNTYALILLICFSFLCAFLLSEKPLFNSSVTFAILFLLPFGMIDIGSRASFIAFIVLSLYLIIAYRKQAFKIYKPFILGLIALTVFYAHAPEKLGFFREKNMEIFQIAPQIDVQAEHTKAPVEMDYMGDENRLTMIQSALGTFKGNELFGAGLGSALINQKTAFEEHVGVVHSTPLWFLVETGLIGLIVFSAFFILCLHRLYKLQVQNTPDTNNAIARGMFLTLICFAVMSLAHEFTYTRQIWFFLGMALCLPLTRQTPAPQTKV